MTGEGGFFGMAVRRPVGALVLFVTMLVVGGIAYRDIPLQLFPSSFSEPELNVWIPTPETSAQENEEKVARVIEEQLRTLTGIEEVVSRSRASNVYLRIEFNADVDLELAKAEVRDRIERARPALPENVDQISMWSEDADDVPLAFFGLLHGGRGERTDHLVDEVVVPRIEAAPGVSNVEIWGGGADSVRILLDEDRVRAARLDLGRLIERLSRDNFTEPLGELDDGGTSILLRSDMRFETPEEIEQYPIGDGLRIGDVGRVRRVKSVRNSLARIDGAYSYTGMVTKESQVNVVEATHALKRTFEEIQEDPRVAGELDFVTFWMPGDMVESSLAQLQETAAWGGLLALVVLFVFLRRLRLTLCVALSIPVSAVMAIAWEYFGGGSFNVLTMAGVTLAIGMLVDNSVVVVENIARFRDEGVPPLAAASRGAREIALAVTLATMTSVVVFLPMMFMTDHPLMKVIFVGIGRPLCVALVFSLLVALAFLPVVAARILGSRPPLVSRSASAAAPLLRLPARLVARLVGGLRLAVFALVRLAWYAERGVLALSAHWVPRVLLALLPWAVAAWVVRSVSGPGRLAAHFQPDSLGETMRDLPVQAFGAAAVASALVLFAMPRWWRRRHAPPARPTRPVPAGDSLIGMVTELNRGVVGWTMEHRFLAAFLALVSFATIAIPAKLANAAAFGEGEDSTSVRFFVDFEADFTLAEAADEMRVYEEFVEERREEWGYENWNTRFDDRGGQVNLYWDAPLRKEREREIRGELEEELPRPAGHRLTFYDGENTSRRAQDVVFFTLRGPDSRVLEEYGQHAVRILETIPGLEGVKSPLEDSPETLQVEIDRDLALEMGVTSEATVNTISYTLRGWPLARFHDEGREIPLVVEYDQEETAGIGTLRDLSVWTGDDTVPLSAFSDLVVTRGDRSIFRRNGQTQFEITAEVTDPSRLMELNEAGYAALASGLDLPRGYSFGTDDSARSRQQEEATQMRAALLLSVVLVFLLMGILFESVLLPFSVLFTIPFAILGAWWTIFLTGIPLDLMGWIGMIILAGVVVNNGIVLVDRIHRLVGEGMPRSEAVVTGCAQRVRPILMTATTTVFGLLPMAVTEPATNSIPYQSLATVVAGGLLASTFFTLWVVPLAYTVLDDLSATVSARVRWWLASPRERAGGSAGARAGAGS